DIERDRQRERRVDSRARRVQRELADRDAHAAGALVAEPEDPFVVGRDDQPHVLVAGVPQQLGDPVDVVGGEPQAPRPPRDVAVRLTRLADDRRVDDRHELLEVLDQQAVEQGLVSVLKGGEPDVLLERLALSADLLELDLHLLLDRPDPPGKQTPKLEQVALHLGERRVLVQQRVLEELHAAVRDLGRLARTERLDPRVLEGPLSFVGWSHRPATSLAGSLESSSTTCPMTALASPKSIWVLSR